MKSLQEYLTENHQLYEYVIRFAQKPSDEDMDTLEETMRKFDLRDCSSPEKIQNSDLDFFDTPYKDIYEVRIATGVKLSPYVLLQDLRASLNLDEKELRVRGIHEPQQQYVEQHEWLSSVKKEATDNEWKPKSYLSTCNEYLPEEKPLGPIAYGDQYNKSLLGYLNDIAHNRDPGKVDSDSSLFSWLDMDKYNKANPVPKAPDFNNAFDTPKAQIPNSKENPIAPWLMNHGGYSDDVLPNISAWQDKNGNNKIKTRKVGK